MKNGVPGIRDEYNRRFKTLRISLTNHCNLGCTYCVPSGESNSSEKNDNPFDVGSLAMAVRTLHDMLALHTVRLTGGEPLLYRELIPFIKAIKKINIPGIKMTTNGYILAGKAKELKAAGLTDINVSLDAIEPDAFYMISRRKNLSKILKGIEQSIDAGLKVKINCVLMKGVNDHQVIPLFRYAKNKNIPIRFLELMKMGHLHANYQQYLFTQKQILEVLSNEFSFSPVNRLPGATADYWQLPGGYQFGIIANESHPFCNDCDRLRLDSYGNIFGCLSSNTPVNIRDCLHDKKKLREHLQTALYHKKTKFYGSALSMKAIGG